MKHKEDSLWPGALGSSAVLVRALGQQQTQAAYRVCERGVRALRTEFTLGLGRGGRGGATASLEGPRNEMAALGG